MFLTHVNLKFIISDEINIPCMHISKNSYIVLTILFLSYINREYFTEQYAWKSLVRRKYTLRFSAKHNKHSKYFLCENSWSPFCTIKGMKYYNGPHIHFTEHIEICISISNMPFQCWRRLGYAPISLKKWSHMLLGPEPLSIRIYHESTKILP